MQTISQSFSLLWGALFLESQAFAKLRDSESPVKKGLIILIVLGLALAVVGIIGVTLEWASSPTLAAIQETVMQKYQESSWWQFMEAEPEALKSFEETWGLVWQILGVVFPTPASSLTGLILRPLGLIISWLIFGLLVHLFARLLGGKANLGQTLGVTSLAAAPQMLGLLTVLPFVVLAGIGTWTLLCRYMAIRVCHGLSWSRTMWSVILPPLLLGFLLFLLAPVLGILLSVLAGGFLR